VLFRIFTMRIRLEDFSCSAKVVGAIVHTFDDEGYLKTTQFFSDIFLIEYEWGEGHSDHKMNLMLVPALLSEDSARIYVEKFMGCPVIETGQALIDMAVEVYVSEGGKVMN